MSNNRLYLCHRPTKLAVCIGKSNDVEWYQSPGIDVKLTEFYAAVKAAGPCIIGRFDFFVFEEKEPGIWLVERFAVGSPLWRVDFDENTKA